MSLQAQRPETLTLRAGWRADAATSAGDTEHAANLFALKALGNIYTGMMNPANDVLERRVAALESGDAALALASGPAASAFAVQNLARPGDNMVSSTSTTLLPTLSADSPQPCGSRLQMTEQPAGRFG